MASVSNAAIRLVRRLEGESNDGKVKEELFEVIHDSDTPALGAEVLNIVCNFQQTFPRVYNILKGANHG